MLSIKPVKQFPSFCGPACMEMVMHYFGVSKTQKEWGKLAKTTLAHGTKAENMVRAAELSGFHAKIKDCASFSSIQKYLKQKIPVIVNWFSTDEGHYSVAVKLDAKNIWLADPELGKMRRMSRKKFFGVWFDFHGAFMKTKNDLILRRMITIKPRREMA